MKKPASRGLFHAHRCWGKIRSRANRTAIETSAKAHERFQPSCSDQRLKPVGAGRPGYKVVRQDRAKPVFNRPERNAQAVDCDIALGDALPWLRALVDREKPTTSALLPPAVVRPPHSTWPCQASNMNAPVKEQKVINAIAIGTCVAAMVLLLSFAEATIAANSWVPQPNTETEKDTSVALSIDKDSDALRVEAPRPAK